MQYAAGQLSTEAQVIYLLFLSSAILWVYSTVTRYINIFFHIFLTLNLTYERGYLIYKLFVEMQ